MRSLLAVPLLVVVLGCSSDDGPSSEKVRACEAWADHKQAVRDGLSGADLVDAIDELEAVTATAGGLVADAGRAMRAAVGDAEAASDAYGDFELACLEVNEQ